MKVMAEKVNQDKNMELHNLVFNNDIAGVSKLLNADKSLLDDPSALKDARGNTPLHLSVMLGHKECTQLLLKHGHDVTVKNLQGWTPMQEAVSYGDRQTIASILRSLRKQDKSNSAESSKPKFKDVLQVLGGDFYMQLHWDFMSWVPLVSKVLPSDTCHIYCKKNRIRMDSTLEDFNNFKWIRGDITLLVDFSQGTPKLTLLDNKNKIFQNMEELTIQEQEAAIEDEVDVAMSTDIVDVSVKTGQSLVERVNTGWIFRHARTEKIGRFDADFYKISSLLLMTRKRREHLSDDDVRRNKALRNALSRGENTEKVLMAECAKEEKLERRASLAPPARSAVSWHEYAASTKPLALGRKSKEKVNTKRFEATVGMSTDFPVRLHDLLPIFEALGPKAKLFRKLKEFITIRLPPGFPVRVDVPIFPTVKATLSFLQFEFTDDIGDDMFEVPSSYREEAGWFERSSNDRHSST